MAYNVYSLPDVKSVLYHPDVGTANLHLCGIGKIVVSAAGDLTSHTTTGRQTAPSRSRCRRTVSGMIS